MSAGYDIVGELRDRRIGGKTGPTRKIGCIVVESVFFPEEGFKNAVLGSGSWDVDVIPIGSSPERNTFTVIAESGRGDAVQQGRDIEAIAERVARLVGDPSRALEMILQEPPFPKIMAWRD